MKAYDNQENIFPGGLDTTVIDAEEGGRAPFDGEVIPQKRWAEFTAGFSTAYEYVHSAEGREFYKLVDAELSKIAMSSPETRLK